jgi:hypothetical protein
VNLPYGSPDAIVLQPLSSSGNAVELIGINDR